MVVKGPGPLLTGDLHMEARKRDEEASGASQAGEGGGVLRWRKASGEGGESEAFGCIQGVMDLPSFQPGEKM